MKRLYKYAEEKIDYSYMFVEWLIKRAHDINSDINKYITKIYMNILKNSGPVFIALNDFNTNLPYNLEECNYQEINAYINDIKSDLDDMLFKYIMNSTFAKDALSLELINGTEIYYRLLLKWAKEEGLNKFCEENGILEENINMKETIQYFNLMARDRDYFLDAQTNIFEHNMDKDALKEYINKNLDEFEKYILKDIIILRNKIYNEEKTNYDEYLNEEKAKDYMNNVMEKGIDYNKLGENRILKRMYKDARKMKRLIRQAGHQDVSKALDYVFDKMSIYISEIAKYLASGKEQSFELNQYIDESAGNKIAMVLEYMKKDDTVKEIFDSLDLDENDLDEVKEAVADEITLAIDDYVEMFAE